MRILTVGNMYPPHHLGGYELVWEAAVEHLRRQGHEVSVLTTDFCRASGEQLAADAPGVHRTLRWYWSDHRWPRITPLERVRLERHNHRELARHLERLRPEVISWWAMGGMSLSLLEAARRRGLPAVAFVQDAWPIYGPSVDGWQRLGRRAGPLRPLLGCTGIPMDVDFARAARWIFSSETLRRGALAHGFPARDSGVLHVGIDPAMFPLREPAPWRWRLLYVGRLDPRKGVATAIAALARLPGEAGLEVIGAGAGEHRDALARLAARAGVAERVSFRGDLERARLAEHYAQADAVLFPVEWEEPWGLVPLEAMSSGVPVIATGRGGSGEYLRDGENALLFRAGEADALAVAIRRLAGSPELRAELVRGGVRTAARFTEAAHNRGVLAELTRAAARPPA